MGVKIESKATIEMEVSVHDGDIKTHPCDVGDWWGEDICSYVNFNDVLKDAVLPEGDYKVTIILERI